MANRYLKLPVAALEAQIIEISKLHVKAVFDGKDDEAEQCAVQLELIGEALDQKKSQKSHAWEESKYNPKSTNASSYSTQKFVTAQIEGVPVFQPGIDVSTFIQACENAYNRVKKLDGGEKMLVDYLPLRLSQEYQTAWNDYCTENDVTRFEQFTEYLKVTYANGVSTFQLLDTFDLLEKEKHETFPCYAVKISNKVSTLATEVKAKFEKAKGRKMTADDVFKVIGGVAMIREVRKVPEAYTSVMTRVENDFNASSIGQLAASFMALTTKTDSVLGQPTSVNYIGGQNTRKKPARCFFGEKCTRKNCRFDHSKRPKNPDYGHNQSSREGDGGRYRDENDRRNDDQRSERVRKVQMIDELDSDEDDTREVYVADSSRVFRD